MTADNSTIEFAVVYNNYRKKFEVFFFITTATFDVLLVLAIALLAVILLSARYVRKWDPILKITYSLAAADLVTAFFQATALTLQMAMQTVQMSVVARRWIGATNESLRLAGMYTALLHLLLIAVQHYCAIAHPISLKVYAARMLMPGLPLVWCLPFCLSVAVHLGIVIVFGEQSDGAFQSQLYRLGCSGLFGVPICVTLAFYAAMLNKMRLRDRNGGGGSRTLPVASGSGTKQQHMRRRLTHSLRTLTSFDSNSHNGLGTGGTVVGNHGSHPHKLVKQQTQTLTNRRRRQQRTQWMAVLLFATFLLSWLPGVVWLAWLSCKTCRYNVQQLMSEHEYVLITGSITVNFLINVKYFINGLLYGVRMPDIRAALGRMFGGVAGLGRWFAEPTSTITATGETPDKSSSEKLLSAPGQRKSQSCCQQQQNPSSSPPTTTATATMSAKLSRIRSADDRSGGAVGNGGGGSGGSTEAGALLNTEQPTPEQPQKTTTGSRQGIDRLTRQDCVC